MDGYTQEPDLDPPLPLPVRELLVMVVIVSSVLIVLIVAGVLLVAERDGKRAEVARAFLDQPVSAEVKGIDLRILLDSLCSTLRCTWEVHGSDVIIHPVVQP